MRKQRRVGTEVMGMRGERMDENRSRQHSAQRGQELLGGLCVWRDSLANTVVYSLLFLKLWEWNSSQPEQGTPHPQAVHPI